MSEQRKVDAIVGKPKTSSEMIESKETRKARIAAVLERGITNDRLHVDLPPELHGEWVSRDPAEILRMQSLGYEIDTTYATKRALNNDGTGQAIIGDVVFMTCSKENKQDIDEVSAEMFKRNHGDPAVMNRRNQREGSTQGNIGGESFDVSDMKRIDESVERTIDGNELKAAIEAATNNKKPS